MKKYIDSPFLWSGKKTKLLPQLLPLFPQSNIFVDLFGGSGSVSVNSEADVVLCNDLFMGNLLKTLNETSIVTILSHVDNRIKQYNLSKDNKEQYYKFKSTVISNISFDVTYYLDLFTLSLFCFNGRLEFNKNKGFTGAFGKRNRRGTIEETLVEFKEGLEKIPQLNFYEYDYIDFTGKFLDKLYGTNNFSIEDVFFYVDCPYSITRINGYKSEYNDKNLFNLLDKLNSLGIKFGMSNVFEHKGKRNEELICWSKKYNTHHLLFDYNNNNNSNINQKKKSEGNITDEVFICNY